MKRIMISVLVVALIMGLAFIGLSPRSAVAQPPGAGVKLVTIAEDLTLQPKGEEGDRFTSEFLDVKDFRRFKLYAKTPYSASPPVKVFCFDYPAEGEMSYGTVGAPYDWFARPMTSPDRYVMVAPFEGLHSQIRVYARNDSSTQTTVSLYLLMAWE